MEAKLLLIPRLASVLYSSIPLVWFIGRPFRLKLRNCSFCASVATSAENESGLLGEQP
jgi:hypothetical protein